MSPEEQLNAIMAAFETLVAAALGLPATRIYESRESGEGDGAVGYVSGTIKAMAPLGNCAEDATVELLVGFAMPEGIREDCSRLPKRVTRVAHTMAIRAAILAPENRIPGVALVQFGDFALSDGGAEERGFVNGGLRLTFHTALQKGG